MLLYPRVIKFTLKTKQNISYCNLNYVGSIYLGQLLDRKKRKLTGPGGGFYVIFLIFRGKVSLHNSF